MQLSLSAVKNVSDAGDMQLKKQIANEKVRVFQFDEFIGFVQIRYSGSETVNIFSLQLVTKIIVTKLYFMN